TSSGIINLICFVYPGGSASYFASWKNYIDERINLLPVLYPGREVRKCDKMDKTFDLFLKKFIEENIELFEIPYAFFGYCAGAVVSYELSALLNKIKGSKPIWNFIASSESPKYLKNSIVKFPDKNDKENLVNYLMGFGIFDEQIVRNDIFLDYYFPMIKADCNMLDTYKYIEKNKMNYSMDVFYGKDDVSIKYDNILDWENYTNGNVIFHECEGKHFFVDNNIEYISNIINNRLISNTSSIKL
uniref:thioesterase II family protein n=1 Tax=Anaerococcus vaginalis TaxID=33037 RepID=UPI00242D5FFA